MRPRVRGRIAFTAAAAGLVGAAGVLHAQPDAAELAARRASVYAALGRIRTAAGVSATDRMRACGFVVAVRPSSIVTEAAENRAYRRRAGGATLVVVFEATALDTTARRPQIARWFIRGSRAEPDTAWAREIQLAPFPIQMNRRTRC